MQAKNIDENKILTFMQNIPYPYTGFTWFNIDSPNSLYNIPELKNVPEKVLLAKMKALIKKGLVEGCACGCSGNFKLNYN